MDMHIYKKGCAIEEQVAYAVKKSVDPFLNTFSTQNIIYTDNKIPVDENTQC